MKKNDLMSSDIRSRSMLGEDVVNELQRNREKLEEENRKRREKAIASIPCWIKRGEGITFPERYELWHQIVYKGANGFYYGEEINCALEIMELLEDGISLNIIKKVFDEQIKKNNYNGELEMMIKKIVYEISSKGPDFWESVTYGSYNEQEKQRHNLKRIENKRLAQSDNYVATLIRRHPRKEVITLTNYK